jgi:hypothetical protein
VTEVLQSEGSSPIAAISEHLAMELNNNMARIIGLCDCLLTPVVDPSWQSWGKKVIRERLEKSSDPLSSYKAKNWLEYTDRGWCRLEMFFSANVPASEDQTKRLRGPLQDAFREQRRAHLVFGDREKELGEAPILLPKLDDKLYKAYLPIYGKLFDSKDKKIIGDSVKELEEINNRLKGIRIEDLKALDLNGAEYTAKVVCVCVCIRVRVYVRACVMRACACMCMRESQCAGSECWI